jgi:hypothetical protein
VLLAKSVGTDRAKEHVNRVKEEIKVNPPYSRDHHFLKAVEPHGMDS